MTITSEVIEAARAAGASTGVSPAVLLAVAIVETNATAFATVGEMRRPLIRFEGHYFDRLLAGSPRQIARAAGLSHPRAGAVRNPVSQAGRWALLARARAIDAEAASASTSFGLCQVMGSHAAALGYESAAALAAEAEASATGQLEIGARFLRLGGLDRLLLDGDVAGFARRYNGPLYLRNDYARKIAAALARARMLLGDDPTLLRIGSRGAAVAALQRALAVAGFETVPDGVFGPATLAALRAFQASAGLVPDGIAGPATRARLVPEKTPDLRSKAGKA